MASKRVRAAHDYKQLNNFSSVVLYKTSSYKKRKTYSKTFLVERIIHRRKVKRDYEYLIKWENWSMAYCSYEPEEHLTSELLRTYERPAKPLQSRLEEAARSFYVGILSALKSSSTSCFYIAMDLDIWRYISEGKGINSNHKGYKLYQIEDFCHLPLQSNWWYYLNDQGEGQAIQPPIKVKPLLSWSPSINMLNDRQLVKSPRIPLEKLCVDILRRACNVNNL